MKHSKDVRIANTISANGILTEEIAVGIQKMFISYQICGAENLQGDQMPDEKLKECPFCGQKASYASTGVGGKVALGCFRCKIYVIGFNFLTAVKRWNRRSNAK